MDRGLAPGPGGHNTNSAAPELADEQEPGPHRRKVSLMPLKFGDLPPTPHRHAGPGAWKDEVAELRANPGKWALLTTKNTDQQARNMTSLIRRGLAATFRPAGAFEATNRGADVWVRYVGEDES